MRPKARICIECDVPEGVEQVAMDEVRERLPGAERIGSAPGKVWFDAPVSSLREVDRVRTAAGAWIVERYDGRKPSVLLADRHLVERIRAVVRLDRAIDAFTFSAPGSRSAAMRTVRNAVAAGSGLRDSAGGLLVRVRRRPGGWDALVAVRRRPLSDRTWRVARSRGAVNGALGAAIVRLTDPTPDDRFLNVACGSGTLAIERRLHGPAARVVGIDVAPEATAAAAANVLASRRSIDLVRADGRALPFPRGTFDVVCADLPWGYAVGTHDRNVADYADLLAEMGRVACRRARACVLSNETRHMQRVLGEVTGLWRLDRVLRVEQGGARPGLYVLRRS